jgi:hypothetical protein
MHDAPRDEDVVELGRSGQGGRGPGWLFGQRFPLPDGWRPSRSQVIAVAALVVGLAAGYATGKLQARAPAVQPEPVRPSAVASPLRSPQESFAFEYPALTQETGACAVQSGRQLTLGVQVTNRSPVPVTLQSAKAVLPLGGLTPGAWHWTPCGALPQTLDDQADAVLQPGASTWLTMLFTVKAGCPAPFPVQFTIGYRAGDRSATANLPGFPDLTQVPYTGCPQDSAASTSAQLITRP